jgi:hypothetical protein
MVWNSLFWIMYGANQRDQESREGSVRGIAKAKTTFGHGEKGEVVGKEGKGERGRGKTKKETFRGDMERIHKRR